MQNIENIYGEKVKVHDDWEEEEKRMNIIGQNGNDGLHYDNNIEEEEIIPPKKKKNPRPWTSNLINKNQ